MRIIGSLVIKNEAGRYLKECLEHMAPFFDDLFVYDDQSTDNSAEMAKDYTDHVYIRDNNVPPFIVHEGLFRFSAWQKAEEELGLEYGDWVLSFDADEFLITENGANVKDSLHNAAQLAMRRRLNSVQLKVHETFDTSKDGTPQIRVDRSWGKIISTRFFLYQRGAQWRDKAMGCGSEPTYIIPQTSSRDNFSLSFLHYGYANPDDHKAKYKRYKSLIDHGHEEPHIESIIANDKQLVNWPGPVPRLIKERFTR